MTTPTIILIASAILITFGWNIDMFISYGRVEGYGTTLKKFLIVGFGIGIGLALVALVVSK